MFTSGNGTGAVQVGQAGSGAAQAASVDASAQAGQASAGAAPSHARIARRYLIAAAGCAVFALVYAQFSHGVYSPFMTFMFAIPLLGGAAVALALHVAKARPLPRATRQAWALALASLTVASCLRGIFEIAGTDSVYLPVYLVAAAGFAVLALVFLAMKSS